MKKKKTEQQNRIKISTFRHFGHVSISPMAEKKARRVEQDKKKSINYTTHAAAAVSTHSVWGVKKWKTTHKKGTFLGPRVRGWWNHQHFGLYGVKAYQSALCWCCCCCFWWRLKKLFRSTSLGPVFFAQVSHSKMSPGNSQFSRNAFRIVCITFISCWTIHPRRF